MNFFRDPNEQKKKNPLYQSLLKVKNISQALTEFLLSETKQRATRFHDTRQNLNCSMKCRLVRTCIGEGKTVYIHIHLCIHTHRHMHARLDNWVQVRMIRAWKHAGILWIKEEETGETKQKQENIFKTSRPAKMLHTGYCSIINACIKVINAKLWSSDFSHVLMCSCNIFVQAEASSRCLSRSTDRNFSCMFPGASSKSK